MGRHPAARHASPRNAARRTTTSGTSVSASRRVSFRRASSRSSAAVFGNERPPDVRVVRSFGDLRPNLFVRDREPAFLHRGLALPNSDACEALIDGGNCPRLARGIAKQFSLRTDLHPAARDGDRGIREVDDTQASWFCSRISESATADGRGRRAGLRLATAPAAPVSHVVLLTRSRKQSPESMRATGYSPAA